MPGEFELIKRYLAAPEHHRRRRRDGYGAVEDVTTGVVLGPGDDAALVSPTSGRQLAISVDTSLADVHFPHDAPPHAIGHRALAVSLSDLAAMGARPRWYLLALTLPAADTAWVAEMARGMHQLAARCKVIMIGGDTTRGALSLSVTVQGEVDPQCALRRDGARPGDMIAIVGTLGGGAGGLALWQQGQRDRSPLLDAYLYPQPRLIAGEIMAGRASAAIDISDGLLVDLQHICTASGVGAILELASLPFHPALAEAGAAADPLAWALQGGDDYALLATFSPGQEHVIRQQLARCGEALTVIGRIQAEPMIVDQHHRPLDLDGWQHF